MLHWNCNPTYDISYCISSNRLYSQPFFVPFFICGLWAFLDSVSYPSSEPFCNIPCLDIIYCELTLIMVFPCKNNSVHVLCDLVDVFMPSFTIVIGCMLIIGWIFLNWFKRVVILPPLSISGVQHFLGHWRR